MRHKHKYRLMAKDEVDDLMVIIWGYHYFFECTECHHVLHIHKRLMRGHLTGNHFINWLSLWP